MHNVVTPAIIENLRDNIKEITAEYVFVLRLS